MTRWHLLLALIVLLAAGLATAAVVEYRDLSRVREAIHEHNWFYVREAAPRHVARASGELATEAKTLLATPIAECGTAYMMEVDQLNEVYGRLAETHPTAVVESRGDPKLEAIAYRALVRAGRLDAAGPREVDVPAQGAPYRGAPRLKLGTDGALALAPTLDVEGTSFESLGADRYQLRFRDGGKRITATIEVIERAPGRAKVRWTPVAVAPEG